MKTDCKIKDEWVKLELEHTKSMKFAKKIAEDHIKEFGCNYYPELIKLERRLKK